jgi:sugar/nucleoside kinase (ribokinase family)
VADETTSHMKKNLPKLIKLFEEGSASLAGKKVTAGFDGFVDTIVRIIKDKDEDQKSSYFKNIKQFGKYIADKDGSFSLEIEEISSRIGGNMPIMANAMAHLGATVNCVGALGHPVLHPVFSNLSRNCKVYSFADPGTSTAYEFHDGKILLGQNGQLNTAGWEHIKNKIGIDKLQELYRNSDLLCFVNWSEIDASTDTWKGLLRDVLPNYHKRQTAFFDLSDCSKRSDEAIQEAMMLLHEFSKYCNVILGLNNNEARLIYRSLYGKKPPATFEKMGEKIFEKAGIGQLILHSSKEAIGYNKGGLTSAPTFFVKHPALSTGAGDNFNAGFCTAQLLGLDMELSLLLANAVAGSYVSSGKNSDTGELIKYIQHAGNLL